MHNGPTNLFFIATMMHCNKLQKSRGARTVRESKSNVDKF
jgi:hypothetical protein